MMLIDIAVITTGMVCGIGSSSHSCSSSSSSSISSGLDIMVYYTQKDYEFSKLSRQICTVDPCRRTCCTFFHEPSGHSPGSSPCKSTGHCSVGPSKQLTVNLSSLLSCLSLKRDGLKPNI